MIAGMPGAQLSREIPREIPRENRTFRNHYPVLDAVVTAASQRGGVDGASTPIVRDLATGRSPQLSLCLSFALGTHHSLVN
eukprot:COSAG02_NODE_330_length_24501_cov_39.465850_25_plen_81_part_00